MSKSKKVEQEFNAVYTVQIVLSANATTRRDAERKIDAILFSTIKRGVSQNDSKFLHTLPSEIDGVKWTAERERRDRVALAVAKSVSLTPAAG